MSDLSVTAADLAKLASLASVIVPGTAVMPAVAQLPGFDGSLRRAIRACGYAPARLRAALDALPASSDWAWARAAAARNPADFRIVSTLIAAAYYMDPAVMGRLGYPVERQHPADLEEVAAEYETGILEPVTRRAACYRDTRGAAPEPHLGTQEPT